MKIYTLHFDGSCGPANPGGTAAYGFVLSKWEDYPPPCRASRYVEIERGNAVVGTGPRMSNNVGEFAGLEAGLAAFQRHATGDSILRVYGDSNLVIQIMRGRWQPHRDKLYYPYFRQAWERFRCIASCCAVNFQWVPREQNTVCDDLSKAHLDNLSKSSK